MRLSGLRPRLTMLVAAVVVVGVGIAFVAVYRGTVGALERQSRRDLTADLARLESAVIVKPTAGASVAARAREFLARQPFQPTEHVTFAKLAGGQVISDQPELLGLRRSERDEPADRVRTEALAAKGFLSAPPGFSVRALPDAGKVRVLVVDVRRDGRLIARLGVGEPTAAADRARDVVLDAFLMAGGLAIAVALAGGFFVASRVARPLRRMARVAAAVDGGEMGSRMAVASGHAHEVKVLGDVPTFLDELVSGFGAGLGGTIEIGTRAPVTVRADPDRLTQALRNLLRNALAQTDGRVVLGAEASAGRVRFTVDDDGPGIPEDQRELVFDRFHRLDLGRGDAVGGAGLGLAIVRVIAEGHGGRAWAAKSALGGARVVVELPLAQG